MKIEGGSTPVAETESPHELWLAKMNSSARSGSQGDILEASKLAATTTTNNSNNNNNNNPANQAKHAITRSKS